MYRKKRKTMFSRTQKLEDDTIPDISSVRDRGKSRIVNDVEVKGLYLNVSGSGTKVTRTWRVRHRATGTTSSFRLGHFPAMGVDEARTKALAFKQSPSSFLNPVEEQIPAEDPHKTFREVFDAFLLEYVQSKKLKSRDEIDRIVTKYVMPEWENRVFRDIKKFDVAELLRKVQRGVADRSRLTNRGPVRDGGRQADVVLSIIRKMTIWYAANPMDERDNDYVSPVVRGMNRAEYSPRKRVLSDEELHVIWREAGAEELGVYGPIIRLLLLTAQRKDKIATMRRSDIRNGVWMIPVVSQEKGHIGKVQLPQVALDLIADQTEVDGNPYIFPAKRGSGPFNTWSDGKEALDARVRKHLPDIERWTVHDLRRTARTLMSRIKVPPDDAERTLGHKIGGVRKNYDWYAYEPEKTAALEALASEILRIVKHRRIRPITGMSMTH